MLAKKKKKTTPKVSQLTHSIQNFSTDSAVRSYHSPLQIFVKVLIAIVIGMITFTIVCLVILLLLANQYLTTFASSANTSSTQIIQSVQTGLRSTPIQTDGRKNILLLGTDALENREGEKVLTDTIMVLSLDVKTGQLYAISFPRDLWVDEYSKKINGIYQIGIDQRLEKPESLTATAIEQLTDLDIHHTIIISLETVAEVIDALGGVQIDIPETFIDYQYPRADVDIKTERDPAKLYEIVEFLQGQEVMNGRRALQYIRSRKSLNPNQGTDDARVRRQQQVIGALIKQVSDPSLAKEPTKLGQLYQIYLADFESRFSTAELISTANSLRSKLQHIDFQPTALSIEQLGQPGVIYHPPEDKIRGWIYEIKDPQEFKNEVSVKLGLDAPKE